ncbi:MAG: transporter substrate-binding domain-containing protein [Porticoccus sp.]|nr:transporter substrate-binding domain-containing protein [Porticoccus sp.]
MVTKKIYLISLSLLLLLSTASIAEPLSEKLGLTEKESQWLKENPTVTFTGDPNWLPYEAFDSHGVYKGIVSEHLEQITRTTGLAFKMSPSKTWSESTEKAKQGLVDILSETDDSDLKSHLNFTIPYISNPIIIAMGNRENYVESITNIKNRKIALIKDYGYAAKIRRKYPNIKFLTVDDIQDGLISVSTGKVDALLCTLALCSYTISELGLNNIKITGKTEFDTKLAFGVQKKSSSASFNIE